MTAPMSSELGKEFDSPLDRDSLLVTCNRGGTPSHVGIQDTHEINGSIVFACFYEEERKKNNIR
jgi:hypothetical protein